MPICCQEATTGSHQLKPVLAQDHFSNDGEICPGVQHAGGKSLKHSIDDGDLYMALIGGELPGRYMTVQVRVRAEGLLGSGDSEHSARAGG